MKSRMMVLALLLSSVSLAQTPPQALERNASWTHERSDLRPDPAARFGRLDNGMRYVIYRNATPPGQVAVRMRIDAGDLMETDAQNGIAHFLEHMAFNGTTNVPRGELMPMLERLGMAFGLNANAFTAPDQTVYMLDIPSADAARIDTALMVMRETASEMLLDSEAIERERGVIQSEERSMYPPLRRGFVARDAFLMAGQLLPRRLDIGDPQVIGSAGRDIFVDYYNRYYRPERATLIVVGDVDPEDIEARIRARFGDWRGRGAAGGEPDQGQPAPRPFAAGSFVAEGALGNVGLYWMRPHRPAADSRAERVRQWRQRLTLAVLNRRLQLIIEAGDAPFSAPSVANMARYRSADQTMVTVSPASGREREAIRQIENEVRRLVDHGILDSELEREIVASRTTLQAAIASAPTRPTPMLAALLIQAANQDSVLLAPAQELEIFEAAAQGFTAADAGRIAAGLLSGQDPLLFATSPESIAGGDAALARAYAEARTVAVTPPVAVAARAWPYESFGAPGRVVEREAIADLGITRVRFANGVTLLVRPSDFAEGQVMVSALVQGGRRALRPEVPTWPLQQGGFIAGGVEGLTQQQMNEALAGRVYSAAFQTADGHFILRGTTRPQDIATQLQVLAAYVTRPGWRPEGFAQSVQQLQTIERVIMAQPRNVGQLQLGRLIRSGDARWGFPSQQEIASARVETARAAIDPFLAGAPLEISVVGDIAVDEAIAAVAATFGALPDRGQEPAVDPALDRIAFTPATGTPHRITHSGRPDVALGMMVWPTNDYYADPAASLAVQLMRAVIQLRAMDRIRTEAGASYSPMVLQEASETFAGWGSIALGAEVQPGFLDRLMVLIGEVADSLKNEPVGADELERARGPVIEQLRQQMAGNEYWIGRMWGGSWDARRLETLRTREAGLQAVTAADIQRVARQYLDASRAFRLIVEPGASED